MGARLVGRLGVGFIGGLLLTASVYAQTPQYRIDSWTNQTGLPGNAVTSVAQTPDGYLWIGTFAGLVRYDGVKFEVIESGPAGLRSHRILALHVDRAGALWIGTERGGVTRYADGTFTTYTSKDGLPNDNVSGIRDDRRGRIWLTISSALVGLDHGRVVRYTTDDGLPATPWAPVIEDQQGNLWFGTGLGLVRFAVDADAKAPGRITTFTTAHGLPQKPPRDVLEDTDGSLWVGTDGGGLVHFLPERQNGDGTGGAARVLATYTTADGLPDNRVRALSRDRAGRIWIGTNGGIAFVQGNTLVPVTKTTGLIADFANAVFEDRESNLWVGTNTSGLHRLKRQALMTYGAEYGLPDSSVVPVVEDASGTLWIGKSCGGLVEFRDGKVTSYSEQNGLPHDCVWSLLPDRDGSLWIGTYGGGVVHLQHGRFTTYHHTPAGANLSSTLALHQDRTGAIWIGGTGGLHRRNADGTFDSWMPKDGLVYEDVRFITEDRHGAIWVGTFGGVSVYKDGTFTNYTIENGLSNNIVFAIHETNDGAMWIGTFGGGLDRFKDGRFVHITARNGLFENVVSRILEDDRGNFWMSGSKSIFRVARKDLDDFADGRVDSVTSVSYGVADQRQSSEVKSGGQPAGWKSRDGRLWFPTARGVVAVDPTRVASESPAPPVVIEQVLVDRREQDAHQAISVPPAGNLEIHYTGLSFSQPEAVRFKYKLTGLDDAWTDVGSRRTAYYSHLPAGRYTFTVIAANPEGVWNTTGASVGFEVVPPFYRTWWFVTLATAGIVGLVFYVYEGRYRRMRQAHAARAAFSRQLIASQEQERTRIAAELHDSLGQHLLIIKNRALLGAQTTNGDGAVSATASASREQFDEIAGSASAAIDEVRHIAYDLRPPHLDRLGLKATIETMVERAAAGTGTSFVTDLIPLGGLLTKDAEINLYRILQESVNNITKHAQATHASITIGRDHDALHVDVQDNGRGFSPDARKAPDASTGGLGLNGIAERVSILGGTHVVRSFPGVGTMISIRVPIAQPLASSPASTPSTSPVTPEVGRDA